MSTDDNDEKDVIGGLVIDTREIIRRIVDAAKGVLGIDSESGAPIILAPHEMLGDRDRVVLCLIGRYLSQRLGKTERNSATLKEIFQDTGVRYNIVRTRVSELRRSGVVEDVSRGEIRIRFAIIERELKEIGSKIK